MGIQCVRSVTQLCPTLSHPRDCSLSGSSVHEISEAQIQEQVAIFFSRGSSQPRGCQVVTLPLVPPEYTIAFIILILSSFCYFHFLLNISGLFCSWHFRYCYCLLSSSLLSSVTHWIYASKHGPKHPILCQSLVWETWSESEFWGSNCPGLKVMDS